MVKIVGCPNRPRGKFQASFGRMALLGSVLLATGLAGCTVEATTFRGPIVVPVAEEAMLVIRALNPPHDCRLVAADAVFPAIYAIVAGPMPYSEATALIASERRRPGGLCRVSRRR